MTVWTRGSTSTVLALMLASCGGTAISPSEDFPNLSGPWSGVIGAGSGGGRALRVTWSATQNGASNASGPATLQTSPAVTDITFSGTLTGSITDHRLSLAYAAPSGVPGSPNCSVAATGSATLVNNTITGNLDVAFASCDGLDLQPPASNQLTLTRQ
jgi:hypothetical protein